MHGELPGSFHTSGSSRTVVDFFNHVNMLYGTISEFCTPTEVSWPVRDGSELTISVP